MTNPSARGEGAEPAEGAEAALPWNDVRRAICELFSPLAHDLRAGLNGITVWTHVLERTGAADPASSVEGIRRAVAQQSELAQELSDCGRALQLQPGERPEPVELEAVLHEAIADAAPRAANRGVQILYRPAPEPVVVGGHPRLLQNLIRLLVRDAAHVALDDSAITIAATRDAHVKVTIAVPNSATTGTRKSLRRAMASILAVLHGGSVQSTSNDAGDIVELILPSEL
jgi:signal transduction histidine kinase